MLMDAFLLIINLINFQVIIKAIHIKSDLLLVWLSRNNNTVIIVRC